MRILIQIVLAVLVALPMAGHTEIIERDYVVELSPIQKQPGPEQDFIPDNPVFFPDDLVMVDVGDSIRVNVTFAGGERVKMQDMAASDLEILRWTFFIIPGDPNLVGYNVTNTLTFMDVRGTPVANPLIQVSNGGGAGMGAFYLTDIVESQFSFTGFQLVMTVNSAISGFPARFWAHDGVSIQADKIQIFRK